MPQSMYARPSTIDEALTLAASFGGDCEYVAGGTDTQIRRRQELPGPRHVIDLTGIRELGELRWEQDTLEIGALVTLQQLTRNAEIANRYPLLREAAAAIATPVIRHSATVGGNLLVSNRCYYYNQSRFWRHAIGSCLRDTGDTCLVTGVKDGKCFSRSVSDLAPALLALNAELTFRSSERSWSLPLAELHVQDGLRPVRLPDRSAILCGIRVSLPVRRWGFRKLRVRQSIDFTSLTAAATLDQQQIVRFALSGVGMAPILIQGALDSLAPDELQRQARRKSKIVENDLVPMHYRQDMLPVYIEELWQQLTSA